MGEGGGRGKGETEGLFYTSAVVTMKKNGYSALDLDLDLLPGGTIRGGKRRALCGATVPPGREERGTDGARGEKGGHRPERGEDSQARAGALPAGTLCREAGRQSPARAPLAGVAEPCYVAGGLLPASATGARHRPRGAGAPVGPRARVGERGTACPAKGIESARKPLRAEAPTPLAATWTGTAGEAHPWTGRRPARDVPQTAAARTRRYAGPQGAYSTIGTVFRQDDGCRIFSGRGRAAR